MTTPTTSSPRILIWGCARTSPSTSPPTAEGGWIATQLYALATTNFPSPSSTSSSAPEIHCTNTRLENMEAVARVLDSIRPDRVINCAGKTGRPNVDWCESHRRETMESNCIGAMVLANECAKRGVHLTVLATGCIYSSTYDATHTRLLSAPFKESDPPNFTGSFYSLTKLHTEALLQHYPDTLVLRLRMPVSDTLHPRSFLTKILSYPHIVDVPNSHSILHELLPVLLALCAHRETGILNFTNPGRIGHNEVLELYKAVVEPGLTWRNFSLEEQARVVKAGRSNCELDAGRLMGLVEAYRGEGWGVEVRGIREAYRACFERMKRGGEVEGGAARV